MSTYAIGDIQGCYDELRGLLKQLQFNPDKDTLWFVGDLVNRGPKSLETLRFIKNLPHKIIVLGNHDLHLLALHHGHSAKEHTLQDILQAPDCEELLNWLRHQPLLHLDETLNYVMVHAGIYPLWKLTEAKRYAKEIETLLQSKKYVELIANMYGNQPKSWNENLTGWDRYRFIINAFTRMRFCSYDGKLDLENTGAPDSAKPGFVPWFNVPHRATKNIRILFGHWAALNGKADDPNVFALDTGCVWGNKLTAMKLDEIDKNYDK